jgi:choline dehydrogenase-like flavoprotein
MSACTERGHSINLDNNDGDMLGVGIGQFNVGDGARASSATVFLNPLSRKSLKNLTVATGHMVSRLLSKDQRITALEILSAIPNELDEPITIHAAKETILTAGCFHSPQLLLLSGIGPAADLKSLGIPVVQDLPAVGQNLQDHSAFACEFIVKPTIFGHNQLLNDAGLLQKAAEDYRSTKSGPLAMFGASAAILFPKLQRIISSKEAASLPQEQQTFLTASRRPSTEIWMHSGPYFYTGPCPPDASVLVLEGLCQNTLSRGSMRLRSSNPRDLPIVDPNYMSHPYDMRVATETLREMLHLANTTALSSIIESILFAPRARSDESRVASPSGEDDDLLEEFIRETLTQGFHAMSTCVMGKKEDSNKVVGTDFRVTRIDKLRIADMSVCPILTTNHTQVNAYLIGERCAEILIEEYSGLKGRTSTKL